ncbi:NYN domain-containing protein [Paenibacillus sp. 1011MAR3C5]|uniref:NYN domain-containing protein n=1 Tax=Paenibacillus sp. 1011MAR3C5 TaxID=1675787 RepID=UPI000E6B99B8|nr:NYN domain-containing protein [Paenibacillus sp. 1011MAR3C5]RJE83031.1 NYN domain-containing protein [Paenibacillus sp. 1011MAR3C5]
MNRRNDVLLVDGYNIIGAWPELEKLKEHDLEDARDKLLDMLADYQGFTGMQVYVVFDAHQVPGLGSTFKQHKLTIVYTKEKETADECIERLCNELIARRRNLYVATSDLVEQHVAFGKGALRISARELLIDIGQNRKAIEQSIREEKPQKRNSVDQNISLDVWSKLERLRRGEK